MRVDKLTLAALEATLSLYRDPERAAREVPVLSMVTAPAESIRARAERVAAALLRSGVACEIVTSEAAVGGGAFPTARLASFAVAINRKADEIEQTLRLSSDAIVGRVVGDRLLLDVRSILPELDDAFTTAVVNALTA